MQWLFEDFKLYLITILLAVFIVIVISIKERENVFKNLVEFFREWWKIVMIVTIPIVIIVALLLGWTN